MNVPPKIRLIAYWSAWLIGLVAGAAQVVTVSGGDAPEWLLIVVGVLLFVQSQVSALAGSNVTEPEKVEVTAPEGATVETHTVIPLDD